MSNLKISQLTGATTPLAGTEVLPIVQSSTTKKVAISDVTAGRSVSVGDLTLTIGGSVTTASEAYDYRYSSGGVGNNARVRYRAVYSGGGSGYGGSFELESRTSSNVWNTGAFTVTDAGNISTTGNFVQATAAKGINFTANSAAAGKTSQLLNWYEEGTFTPVVADAATGGNTGTAALAKGRYTRVGRTITVTIAFLDITTTGMTAGNTLYVRALPYTSVTDAFVNFIGSQANSQLASTNGAIYPVLGNNSSAIYFLDGITTGSNNTIKVLGITSGQTDLYITLTYEAA